MVGWSSRMGSVEKGEGRVSKTYEDGLEDAWKAARRICAVESGGGLPVDDVRKLFGNGFALVNFSAQEAIEKLEEYDKSHFEVGDVVKSLGMTRMVMGTKGVVTGVEKISGGYWVMWSCGETEYCGLKDIEKTTTHFSSVKKILDNLKYLEEL